MKDADYGLLDMLKFCLIVVIGIVDAGDNPMLGYAKLWIESCRGHLHVSVEWLVVGPLRSHNFAFANKHQYQAFGNRARQYYERIFPFTPLQVFDFAAFDFRL